MTDFYLGPCGTAKSSPPEQRESAPLPLASLLLCPTCARGQVCLGAGDFLPSACVLPSALATSGLMGHGGA